MRVILPYTLKLTTPVIITALSGNPNNVSTMNYIPGSSIRGAVARGIDKANPELLESLILSGKVIYLNAYPKIDGRRALPIPHSYRVEKNDDSKIYDLAAYDFDNWPEIQMTRPQNHFITIAGPDKYTMAVNISSRIHHQRNRSTGKVGKEDGVRSENVFVYDSIDADQSFIGYIIIDDTGRDELETNAKTIKEVLGTSLILGRSRRAGYGGHAKITWHDEIPHEIDSTGTLEVIQQDITKGSLFRILFLSDCIVRSPSTGQVDPSIIMNEMEYNLDGKARSIQNFMYSHLVGGYNKKWGLEIPQSLAVGAGSIIVMEATDFIPLSMIRSNEDIGVGERKIEGFGRIVYLNRPTQHVILKSYNEISLHERPNSDPPQAIIIMEQRLLQKELMRECDFIARNIASCFVKSKDWLYKPSNTLIGKFRVALRKPSKIALDVIQDWFKDSSKTLAVTPLVSSKFRIDGRTTTLHNLLHTILNADYKNLRADGFEQLCQEIHIVSPKSARAVITSEVDNIRARIIDTFFSEVIRLRKTHSFGD